MHTGSTTFSLGGSAAGSPLPLVDLDCSSNPNYPAAAKGYRIRVTIAGKIGGASGKVVEAGDVVEAVADNAGGTEASVGTSWIVIQANIAGMTAAGLSMITAADAAAQAALLTTLMPKAGGSFTGLTGAGFRDTSAAFDVTQTFTSSTALDAGRSITWDVKNASHQLKFTAASVVTFPAGTVTLAHLGANTFAGAQTFAAGSVSAPSITFAGDTNTGFYDFANGAVAFSSNGVAIVAIDTYVALKSTTPLAWSVGDPATVGVDTHLWRRGAANLGMGQADGAPSAQTFGGAQGSGTNVTGGIFNIGTRGTGTGTGGIINFQSHAAGASGSTLGTLVTVASTLSDRFKVASGMLLQIGNAAATEALVCDKSIQFLDSTGTAYKVPCVAA